MQPIRTESPPTGAERAAARTVERAAARHDGHPSLDEGVWRDLEAPTAESRSFVAGTIERPRGYAHLMSGNPSQGPRFVGGLAVMPADRTGTVARVLLLGLTHEVEVHGGGRLGIWVKGADDTTDALFASVGFRRAREQYEMRVPLPLTEVPQWPPGTTTRSFRCGEDEPDWLRVNNRAFGPHPEQGGWHEDTLQRRMAEPWFDPAGLLLAIAEDVLEGFCWTKVHAPPDTPDRLGEIFVIGVDPARQGTGLGRALVVAGLDHLATARGCSTGVLFVDASNGPVLALYRALGFAVHRIDRAYECEVPTA